MISVLLSAFNESANPLFWETIKLVQNLKDEGLQIELIVAATTGHDDTLEKLTSIGVTPHIVSTQYRGVRYNLALKFSTACSDDWVILNHPRSLLQKEAIVELCHLHQSIKWGAFTHQFDHFHILLSFTSWWSNYVRGDIKNIFYLDHCLFVRRSFLEKIGGVPAVEIFEDTLLSLKLAALGPPVRVKWKSTTSAVRFLKNGIWKQAFQNQILKIRFLLGESDMKMNEVYEKDMNLNREES